MKSLGRYTAWVLITAMAAGTAMGQEGKPEEAEEGKFRFRMEEVDKSLTVGYAVSLDDVNGDGKRDVCVVDSDRVVWFENPTWKMQVMLQGGVQRDNVCFAPYDVDGDGKLDYALGAHWKPFDTVASGSLHWLKQGETAGKPFSLFDLDKEPTIHRIRWADLDGDGRAELLSAPLMGRGTTKPKWQENPVRITAYKIPAAPASEPWPKTVINEDLHVCHNFQAVDLDGDGVLEILVVSFEGVSVLKRQADGSYARTLIGEGNQKTDPNTGASEIKHGRLAKSDYIATIEPWHGFQVVTYTRPEAGQTLWRRHVIDDQLQWGHAVWCANLDDDPDEELIIGVRDNKNQTALCGVRIYDPVDPANGKWTRTLIDPSGVAVEDLAAADLNGDGKIDLVAVGRATKNVRVYWNLGK